MNLYEDIEKNKAMKIIDLVSTAKFLPSYVEDLLATAIKLGEYEEINKFWEIYIGPEN
jgi:hypothetical protein